MLELGPLPLEHIDLRECGVQQRLLLRHVQARGSTQVMAVGGQYKRAPLQGNGACQHVKFGVQCTKAEVVHGEVGCQHQPGVLQVGCRLFSGRAGTINQTLHPARQIHFVADRQRRRIVVLDGRKVWRVVVRKRPVRRDLLARRTRAQAHLRKQAGGTGRDKGACLGQPCVGCSQRLVAEHGFLFQRIELRVAETFPPGSLGRQIIGRAGAPGCFKLPGHGHVDSRFSVGRTCRAAGKHERGQSKQSNPRRIRATHGTAFLASAALPLSATTCLGLSSSAATNDTSSPSASESDGFNTSRSPSARPSVTSTFSP